MLLPKNMHAVLLIAYGSALLKVSVNWSENRHYSNARLRKIEWCDAEVDKVLPNAIFDDIALRDFVRIYGVVGIDKCLSIASAGVSSGQVYVGWGRRSKPLNAVSEDGFVKVDCKTRMLSDLISEVFAVDF